MKKLAVLAFLLLLFATQTSRAQEEKDYRFTIKTNPLAALGGPLWVTIVPLTGEYKVLFESRTAQRQSIEVGAGYLGPSVLINLDRLSDQDSISGVRTSGFRVQLTYKFFLTKNKAPNGFFVGPHFSYAKARIANKENTNDEFTAAKLNADILIGYQLITKGGFAMNVYTGLGLKLRDYQLAQNSTWDFDYNNQAAPNVAFGFTFGYAF